MKVIYKYFFFLMRGTNFLSFASSSNDQALRSFFFKERDAEEARDIRVKIAIYGSLGANVMLFALNVFNALTSASYSGNIYI